MTAPDATRSRSPVLEVRDLSYAYEEGQIALAGITLEIADGERVGLVGPNGAGKSTLLLSLVGLLGATGTVVVDGVTLSRKTTREVRAKVGLVFQDPDDQLFMPTVGEDVAFGPRQMGLDEDEVRERVRAALAAVGLEGFEERVPYRLSGGERRAASLATVLSMRPRLLALDEPTNGLDPRARRRVLGLLCSRSDACLLATHDLESVLELCSRVVLLDEGRVVAEGAPRTVLADAELLRAHGLEVPLSIRLARPDGAQPDA